MIKACIFDAFGTLFNLDETLLSELDHPKASEILSYARSKQLSYTWLRSLMKAYINFEEITIMALRDGCRMHDAPTSLVDQLSDIYFKPSVFGDVIGLLKKLKASSIRVGILSNGTNHMLSSGIENNHLKAYINSVYSADDIKIYKPAPIVYEMVCKGENINPEQVLFISSNQWDVAGAHQFGFQCTWLNRNKAFKEGTIDKSSIIELYHAEQVIDLI